MTKVVPDWKRIAVTRYARVTEALVHTDGGPLVFDALVHRELMELADWLRQDRQTKVLVFGGTGDAFCAAFDTRSYRTPDSSFHDIWVEGRRGVGGLLDLDIPMISVANGPALYHSELLVIGDIVLGCPETTFADHAHFTKNIVPGDGVQVVWRQLLGPSRATYFLMTGAVIGAEDALRLGVIHEIHPRGQLLVRAHEIAGPMSTLPSETLMYTRMALRAQDRREFNESVSHGLALSGLQMHLTGQRRPPVRRPDELD